MTSLTLASKSAARVALLRGAGVTFEAMGSGVNEAALKEELLRNGVGAAGVAAALADAKALAVAWEVDGLVIGADQTLEFDGQLIDKAESMGEARARLASFRGKSHQLHSAVTIARGNDILWRELDSATLRVRDFSDAWLEAYLARAGETVLGSVGCYMLEGEGVQLFEAIEGDYFAILGLPLLNLLAFLRDNGVIGA